MRSVIDEKRRVTIPKPLADDLGLQKGTAVVFRRAKDVILMKETKLNDSLEEIMSWNPRRTSKPELISEREMKEIWR